MQTKYKRAIIISIISLIVTIVLLVTLGLSRLQIDEYGLNFSAITSSCIDEEVYGPGLYMIGVANTFLRVKKNQQIIRFSGLKTYSSDFYDVSASIEVSYILDLSQTSNRFSTLQNFYINFGQSPNKILEPLMKNEIINLLSSKNCSYYQEQTLQTLESQISTQITTKLSSWMTFTVNVVVESLVCQGISSNTQIIQRQIQKMEHQLSRTVNQQIQLTDFFTNLQNERDGLLSGVNSAINQKITNLQQMLNVYGNGTGLKIAQYIYENQPLEYNMNLVNLLEQIAAIGNRTFPY